MYSITKNSAGYLLLVIGFFSVLVLILLHALITGHLEPTRNSVLVIPSIILFIIILILGIISPKLYFIFLIFQMIAFPSVFNYIFPSVLYGISTDTINTPYPFITNIDIYLIFGIILGIPNKEKKALKSSRIAIILICILLSFLINLVTTNKSELLYLLFVGSYHIRFILLFYLLFNIHDITKFEKELLIGMVVSILFLFLEATVNSKLNGYDRLTSGTLALNTFGNIIGAIGVSLFFYTLYFPKKRLKTLAIIGFVFSIIIVFLTKNRSSFFAICIGIPFIYLIQTKKLLKLISYISISSIILVIALNVLPMRKILSILPYRVNIFNYTDKIHLGNGSISIEPSPETNPLISRLKLYNTSIKMLKDHPIAGVGVGRWNYLKGKYGYEERIVLDSHNGILALLSQYGLLCLPFIYCLYLFPIVTYRKEVTKNSLFSYMIIINIMMFFCDLTNAGIFKYQVSSLMIFIMFITTLVSKRLVAE